MTQVPASSHGAAAFNGGSITGALDITGVDSNGRQLTIEAPAGHASDVLRILADSTDTTNTEFVVDQHGNLRISSGGAFQEAILTLLDNTGGLNNTIVLDTFSGVLISPEVSANTLLTLGPQAGHTGKLLQAKSTAGLVVTEIPVTGGIKTAVITSGALPTVAPVSATAFQCSTTRDVFLTVPVTYNPGVATTATCKVELSPDNVTFSELVTITQPVGTVFDGSIEAVQLVVPAGWRVKLTVTNATLGTGTYY